MEISVVSRNRLRSPIFPLPVSEPNTDTDMDTNANTDTDTDTGADTDTDTDPGEIVGGVRLEATDPGRVKLSRLGVHEDWKGKGIGTALVDHAEAWARDAGHAVVWLTTPGDHPYLPDLYRRRGYERTGDYPLEYRNYDEIVMEKPLR